jgi:alpha-L-fucosidase
MDWWKDARFGLFIHWGIYSVPAGEWNGKTDYAEWIRNNAQIPLKTYDQFVQQFNPVKFNADDWVKMAKNAGMKYIVITSKHHDGFCMFDTKQTDFDIMSTPFHRDPLKELSEACKKEGIRLCFYHSIMDWHHPDYLPRRGWEKDRPTDGANFDNYVTYMKNELKELLTNYGPIGVLWFDGEWEGTWTHERGKDLYNYVRSLQPNIIINNRVDKGRNGLEGSTSSSEYKGDFGTPEQEIPATGIPGADWESCMTMNNNWGYNSHDNNWKTPQDLVQKLIDIASKGGNFLLNIGPTSEGVFPSTAIDRLQAIGSWTSVNGESIYGTSASPFKKLAWGRCTQKEIPGGTRLYLHIFDWPADNKLVIPGLGSEVTKAWTLKGNTLVSFSKKEADYILDISGVQKQDYATVIVMDIKGKPIVYNEPSINAPNPVFTDQTIVNISSEIPNATIHYTLNGTEPTVRSLTATKPFVLNMSATIKAKCFIGQDAITSSSTTRFDKVTPRPAKKVKPAGPGLTYAAYEGNWSKLPDFKSMSAAATGTDNNFDMGSKRGKENYGDVFDGLINAPTSGIYIFTLSSDDGSKLLIDDSTLIDNDGLHGLVEKRAYVPLSKGYHNIKVLFFQASGGDALQVFWKGPGFEEVEIPDRVLFRK